VLHQQVEQEEACHCANDNVKGVPPFRVVKHLHHQRMSACCKLPQGINWEDVFAHVIKLGELHMQQS
jgi:hypothetical protein